MLELNSLDHLDTDNLSRQLHEAAAARAVGNSGAWETLRLLDGVSLPSYESTPADLAAEMTAFDDKLQLIRKRAKDGVEQVRCLINAGDSVEDFDNLGAKIDAHRGEQLSLLRDVAELFTAGVDLSQRHVAALRPIKDQRSLDEESEVASVKVDMERVGCNVLSMPQYSHYNPEAAEKQFDRIARGNIKVVWHTQLTQQAIAAYNAATDVMHRLPARLEATRQLLRKNMMKAVTRAV